MFNWVSFMLVVLTGMNRLLTTQSNYLIAPLCWPKTSLRLLHQFTELETFCISKKILALLLWNFVFYFISFAILIILGVLMSLLLKFFTDTTNEIVNQSIFFTFYIWLALCVFSVYTFKPCFHVIIYKDLVMIWI